MPVEQIEHYTIRCRDLERTCDFYRDVIGLTVGPRPNFNFPGYWLYCGGVPVVHLVKEDGSPAAPDGHSTGAVDHIAFRGSDVETTKKALTRHNIVFRHNAVPDFRLQQIFVHDPDGIQIELNFRE